MAKFGFFPGTSKEPTQEIDGDYMTQHNEYITIHAKQDDKTVLVAVLRLGEGHRVVKSKD